MFMSSNQGGTLYSLCTHREALEQGASTADARQAARTAHVRAKAAMYLKQVGLSHEAGQIPRTITILLSNYKFWIERWWMVFWHLALDLVFARPITDQQAAMLPEMDEVARLHWGLEIIECKPRIVTGTIIRIRPATWRAWWQMRRAALQNHKREAIYRPAVMMLEFEDGRSVYFEIAVV